MLSHDTVTSAQHAPRAGCAEPPQNRSGARLSPRSCHVSCVRPPLPVRQITAAGSVLELEVLGSGGSWGDEEPEGEGVAAFG